MAVEVEAAGQVDQFLRILQRRIWWIVLPLIIIGSLGTFFAVVVPKKYVSKTQILVRNLEEDTGSQGSNASAVEGSVAKFNVRSHVRIDSVLNKLRLAEYQALGHAEKTEYREELMEDLSVYLPSMPPDSNQQIVEITYKDTSGSKARTFLAELKRSWTDEVLSRHQAREESELRKTREKLDDLVKRRATLAEDMRKIRLEYRIPPPSEVESLNGDSGLPPSFRQNEDLTKRVSELEQSIGEYNREIELASEERDEMPEEVEVAEADRGSELDREIDRINDDIVNLQDEIRLKDWSPSHQSYVNAMAQVKALEDKKLDLQRRNSARVNFDGSDFVPNVERIELAKKVQKMERERDQMVREKLAASTKISELQSLNDQLVDAFSRLDVLRGEFGSIEENIKLLQTRATDLDIRVAKLRTNEGDPFEILLEPTEAAKPTSPNPWVISIGSILFGLGLGLGLAILKEYSKSCFRSARELNRVMTHPVLGTINGIRTRRERARAFLLRAVMGGGSLVFLLAVGYVTWAWGTDNTDALTDPLVRAIQNFRKLLM